MEKHGTVVSRQISPTTIPKGVVALPSKKEIALDLRRADSFDVARSRQIEASPGDKVLVRANDKELGLINGQVLTISSIAPGGADQGGRVCSGQGPGMVPWLRGHFQ